MPRPRSRVLEPGMVFCSRFPKGSSFLKSAEKSAGEGSAYEEVFAQGSSTGEFEKPKSNVWILFAAANESVRSGYNGAVSFRGRV